MNERTPLEIQCLTRESVLKKHFQAKVELIRFYHDEPNALADQIEKLAFQTAKLLESIGERFTYDTEYYTQAIRTDHKGTT